MEVEISSKTSTLPKNPHIKKGYYLGKLVRVMEKKKDGNFIEAKHGRKLGLFFEVYSGDINSPVGVDKDGSQHVLELPFFIYSHWKNDDGSLRTAFTPNSSATKVLLALGWSHDWDEGDTKLDLNSLVGCFAELNIDDYDAEVEENGQKVVYKASRIKEVQRWEGEAAPTPPPSEGVEVIPEEPAEVQQ